jgi:hypothetical protein
MDREEAKQLLSDVLKIIEDMEVPQDLRQPAFEQLWARLGRPVAAPTETGQEQPIASEPLKALAKRLDIDPVQLADLYATAEDGSLDVQVPSSKLPDQKAAATKELALLVCAGRQAIGEHATAAATIRNACNQYGKLDGANFAATMKDADHLWMIAGQGREKTYKLRNPGWEEAKKVVERLAGIS